MNTENKINKSKPTLTFSSDKWKTFFKRYYKDEILLLANEYPDRNSLTVSFRDLEMFDRYLSEELLENPSEMIPLANNSIADIELPIEKTLKSVTVRFIDIPYKMLNRNLRSKHLMKFISIEGMIRKVTEVRPKITNAAFYCMRCEHITFVPQTSQKFVEPVECENDACGRKGPFKILISKSTFVDAQKLQIQESPESLKGGSQPQSLDVEVENDLAGIVKPGDRVIVNGILNSHQRTLRDGKSPFYDLILNANSLIYLEKEFDELEITPIDEKEILDLSNEKGVYEKIVRSIAPSIYGYDNIKEALALQLFSGVSKFLPDGTRIRGDIHILLMGDPGVAKSQLLRYIVKLAPRGVYASGRSASSAGLTAAAVKDDLGDGRWTIEAGALVMADMGVAAVDELDKMRSEDKSSLHEAMEQQSYHPDFEILFADGSVNKIGKLVDDLIESNKDKIINGKDCEILSINTYEILTTDFKKIFSTKINRVSRHKAPKYFLEITFSNGRKIKVTPEHPLFVYKEGEYKEIEAKKLEVGCFIPAPRKLSFENQRFYGVNIFSEMKKNEKNNILKKIPLNSLNKKIEFPDYIDANFARFLGYLASEGHSYYHPENHYAEIRISNTDSLIISDVEKLCDILFKTSINYNVRPADSNINITKDLTTLRLCSVPLYKYFKENFEGLILKSEQKFITNNLRTSSLDIKVSFLKSAFKGDGFIDSERFGFITASYDLARGYGDFLLEFGCWNYIAKENRNGNSYYKVVISGYDNMVKFLDSIVEKDDKRYYRLHKFCKRSRNKLNDRDLVPLSIIKQTHSLLKKLRISDGYFVNNIKRKQNAHTKKVNYYVNLIKTYINEINLDLPPNILRKKLNITLKQLSNEYGCTTTTIYNLEKRKDLRYLKILNKLAKDKLEIYNQELSMIEAVTTSDLRFVTIKSVKKIKNKYIEWVYDVTVEPNQTFISEGLVLHNTISIAKAGILATLKSRCALLAAANPKYGRFDRHEMISGQINVPPALLSRFDLLFILQDVPNNAIDTKIANHIISAHYAGELLEHKSHILDSTITQKKIELQIKKIVPEIDPELMRKYIAYARRNVYPIMEEDAQKHLVNFYIELRSMGEGIDAPVPVTARQLEALVRIAEASSRTRLSNIITLEDAKRTTMIVHSCLKSVGTDPVTGVFDADRIASGTSKSQRDKIKIIKGIIQNLTKISPNGKALLEDVYAEAENEDIDKSHTEELIAKMIRAGEIMKPDHNHIRLTG